ncbi:MAG: S8 family serine peptidase [Solirubrobacterales bacterium]
MSPGSPSRSALLSIAALLVLGVTAAPAAGAALPAKSPGTLTPLLQRLGGPALRSAPPARQAAALGIAASGPGSLLRAGGRLLVEARFDHGALASRGALLAAGGQVLHASRAGQSATVAVPAADLAGIAAVPTVASVRPLRTPLLYAAGCEGGSVLSEGIGQLGVDSARSAYALRGKGVTVGILSDSFDAATEAAPGGPIATHAAADVASNDLPGPASTCSDQQVGTAVLEDLGPGGGADEGRAMAQIVHDVAPHASLAFATAFTGEEEFAANIERLARPVAEGGAGAKVIVDDVGYFEEPFFQDGPVANAIARVTAAGVTYLTAAGNDNLLDSEGHEIASWEAPQFRDAGACPAAVAALPEFNGTHCMDFAPGAGVDTTFGITVSAGATLTVDLQWAEPWGGVGTDLDALLLSGGQVVAAAADQNDGANGTQRPLEILQWENKAGTAQTVQLAVNRYAGGDPRLKLILLQNGSGVSATEYPQSSEGDVVGPAIFGHAGSAAAIAVGAVPFSNSSKPEKYSSRGPATHYFGPVQGAVPAPALGSPEVLAKPDLVATDCGATTFFASLSGGVWRFCGTSAAAPHAAGIAALMVQGDPAATPAEIRTAMTESALPVGAYPPSAVGAGLLSAGGALESLGVAPGGEDGPSTAVAAGTNATEPLSAGPSPGPAAGPEVAGAEPATWFERHPRHRLRTRRGAVRVGFRFASDQGGVAFLCQVDGGFFHRCGAALSRRFGIGPHVIRVKARGADGTVDASPAVFRFRVERVLRPGAPPRRRS